MRRVLLLLVLLAALPAHAEKGKPKRDPFEIWSDKMVGTALDEADRTLAEVLGRKPPKTPRVVLSSREFFFDIAYAAVKRMQGVSRMNERAMKAQAVALCHAAFGYYQKEVNTVHLLPENFAAYADATGDEGFVGPKFLQMVLTHELVHAWDHQAYPAFRKADQTKDTEQYKVFYALIEGHAQWVTEKAMQKAGLGAEFQRFTKASFSPPPDLSEDEQPFAWRASASIRYGYVDGHRFFTGLEASGNPKIVDEVMASPPKSVSVILHPTRYFIPEEVAELPPRVAMVPALDEVLATHAKDWKITPGQFDEQVLKAELVMAPTDLVFPVLSKFVAADARIASSPKGDAYAACVAIQTTDAEAARDLFETLEISADGEAAAIAKATGRDRSERMAVKLRPTSKLPHRRTIEFEGKGKNIVPIYSVMFADGPYVAECTFVNAKKDDYALEELITQLRKGLAAAKPAAAPTPAPAAAKPAPKR